MVVRQRRYAAAAAVLGGLLASPGALGAEKVLWAALDFPPFQVRDGEFRGSGSFDGLLDLLVARLPDLEHEVLTMTFARREDEMRNGVRLCTPGLFRTAERERYLVFSLPALIHLDNRVITLASRAHVLGSAGPVDLEALLARPDLVGGIFSQRSFAPNIDPLVRRHASRKNLVVRALRPAQMFEMLLEGELDWAIMFPHEAAFLARKFPGSPPLAVSPILGTPPYSVTAVACTKGPWGEAMIARVDAVLRRERDTPAYRALSERWYGEADRALIRRYYPQLLGPEAARR